MSLRLPSSKEDPCEDGVVSYAPPLHSGCQLRAPHERGTPILRTTSVCINTVRRAGFVSSSPLFVTPSSQAGGELEDGVFPNCVNVECSRCQENASIFGTCNQSSSAGLWYRRVAFAVQTQKYTTLEAEAKMYDTNLSADITR